MVEKLSLRIDNGVRIIEVNDNGDTITLKLGDSEFQKKALKIYNSLSENIKKLETITEDTPETEKILEDIRISLINETDDLIGENTCQKVFGDISPSFPLLMDFFDKIIPFFNEYNDINQKRSNQIMTKYNPSRKGR